MPLDDATAAILDRELGGRPPLQVRGRRAMVSSMHPDASLAGVEMLREGGNAVDAAIAVAATIAVTNHNWSGLAGDSVWLVHDAATGESLCLDGYSTCAASLTAEGLTQRLDLADMPEAMAEEPEGLRDRGIAIAMVPGTPAAIAALHRRFATLPMARLFARAIELAAGGTPVSRYVAGSLEKMTDKLGRFEASRRIFFRADGGPLREGDILVQADLAETLGRYARDPEGEFATGETAGRILRSAKAGGGAMTAEDLAAYRPAWRVPLAGTYRGRRIVTTPPPTSGAHVLQALAILDHFPLDGLGYHSPQGLNVLVEAVRSALADRRALGGDPDHAAIDVAGLLDPGKAAERARAIRDGKVAERAGALSTANGTTHFVVVDANGLVVSATQSIGGDFGCGEVADGTGLVMNDRTWWMSLGEGPNRVAPRRRANIGHAPTLVFDGDEFLMALGSPGGFGIVQYVVQILVNVLDHGLDLQSAIDAPRFRIQDLRGKVAFEDRFDPATLEALGRLGHKVAMFPAWTDLVGGVEGVTRDPATGALLGGHDVRRNSMAAGF